MRIVDNGNERHVKFDEELTNLLKDYDDISFVGGFCLIDNNEAGVTIKAKSSRDAFYLLRLIDDHMTHKNLTEIKRR